MCSYKRVKRWSQIAGLTIKNEFTLDVEEVDKRLAIDLIQEEFQELKDAIKESNAAEVIDALNDLQWVVDRAKQTFGVKPNSFNELVNSNHSKFCDSKEEAIETQRLYAEGLHPNKIGVKIETTIHEYDTIFTLKDKNGKLLKSKNFIDCDYSKYLKNGKR